MKRQTSIEVRVTEKQKTQWKEHAEQSNEVTNLSELIRLAVHQKINGILDKELLEDLDTQPNEPPEGLDEISNQQTQILERLEDIDARVTKYGDAANLIDEIRGLLIEVPNRDAFEELCLTGTEHRDQEVSIVGTASAFAEYLDEDLGRVRGALADLAEEFTSIEYTTAGYGGRQYFKINRRLNEVQIPDEIDPDEFKTATTLATNE
jgi:hypothetical protein